MNYVKLEEFKKNAVENRGRKKDVWTISEEARGERSRKRLNLGVNKKIRSEVRKRILTLIFAAGPEKKLCKA